ncbi:MAG: hybrid sensor histidine kinase/response regulator, partial [Anaerolineae bacterium]|nr:hybrid sensor histidine kinase/response regulator [Anaerolineae bacterium]
IVLDLVLDRETRHPSIKLEWGDKTLSVSFAPVRGRNSEVTGTVGVFRDFTREAELDRMKNDFISIASHELRTPLTSIRGYLDLVLMGAAGPIGEQQRSFLQIVNRNADRLHELVNDLLDISRIESGQVELNISAVSLHGLIDEVSTLFQNQFDAKGLDLIVDVPEDLPEILADPARLSQVFRNLVSNAHKYTRDGAVIIRARAADSSVQIDIQDSGIGITNTDLDKLFTRFFRATDPLVREQSGTGLGLHITKSLVEMHGGKIWVKSEIGVGTTFSVALPVPGLGVVLTGKQPEGSATTRSAGAHILVVDDEPDIAQLIKAQLESAGHRVDTVTKGTQVLPEARRLKPDLITLDLLMDLDGLAILKQLKDDPILAGTPVIVISVLPGKDRGLTMGAADYLVKPFDLGELLSTIERVLGPCDETSQTRLLVVDDDPDIRHWLRLALADKGFEVRVARDGAEALNDIDTVMPDLVLLDMMMPVMNGREMLEVLREQEETRNLAVIVLTAVPFDSEEERNQILNMGVTKLLHKPVTAEQLAEAIEAVLN